MFVKVKEVMKSIVSRSTFLQQFYWLAESSKENVEIEIISTLERLIRRFNAKFQKRELC